MMKILKRLGMGALAVVVLLLAAVAVYVTRSFPTLDGELKAPGLQKQVTIERDRSDVTHIKAQSAHDVYFALGYVHAQERGWQLEFNRRVMHGELSEVIGEATLEADKFMRTLGVMRAARKQLDGLPADAKAAPAGLRRRHQRLPRQQPRRHCRPSSTCWAPSPAARPASPGRRRTASAG